MSKYKWGRKETWRVEFRRRGCAHRIGGEKDREEGNVNEVTHLLLISTELRLRVFNENEGVERENRRDIGRET